MLANKYRPVSIRQIIGESQQKAAAFLQEKVLTNQIVPAVLLIGPSGCGKTTLARFYANMLLCENLTEHERLGIIPCGECVGCKSLLAIQEVNCSAQTGIDFVRTIIEGVNYKPLDGRYKIYILDEVHGLTKQAQNALLKILEEPPPHVIFILATTENKGIIPTLRSRTVEFILSVPTIGEFIKLGSSILNKEKSEFTPETLREIAGLSQGNLRTFLMSLEKYIEGVYNPVLDVLENNEAPAILLARALLGKHQDTLSVVRMVDAIDDYNEAAVILCNYFLRVLQKEQPIQIQQLAKRVLFRFGDGLPQNAVPRLAFYKRIFEITQL